MRKIRFSNAHDATMYNKGYEQGRTDVIDAVVDEVIFPLLDEYDIHLWEHIDYIELAEKWVEAVKNNPYPKIKDYDKQIKKYLKDWIIEKLKR